MSSTVSKDVDMTDASPPTEEVVSKITFAFVIERGSINQLLHAYLVMNTKGVGRL